MQTIFEKRKMFGPSVAFDSVWTHAHTKEYTKTKEKEKNEPF